MTLQEFLDRCKALESEGNPTAGLLLCDELLAQGGRGRLYAQALRYKAVFLLIANQGWVLEAVGHLKEALGLTRAYPRDQAGILTTLIAAYGMFGSCDAARQYADKFCMLLDSKAGDQVREWTPKIWFNLGYAYDAAGEYALAAEAYLRALETAPQAGGKFNAGYAEHNLVQMYLHLDRIPDAQAMLNESRKHLDMNVFGGHSKDQEAQCLLRSGRYAEARAACRAALNHPSGTDELRAEALLTLARIEDAEGNSHSAFDCAQQAQDLAIRLPNPRLVHKIGGFQKSLRTREEVH